TWMRRPCKLARLARRRWSRRRRSRYSRPLSLLCACWSIWRLPFADRARLFSLMAASGEEFGGDDDDGCRADKSASVRASWPNNPDRWRAHGVDLERAAASIL